MVMAPFRVVLASLVILAGAAACGGRATPGQAPTGDRNTLTPEEIGQRPFYSAYEAIESLRPAWLSGWGPSSGGVQVYVDDIHVGGTEALRTIRIPSISVIKHLDGIQAPARYGRGHEKGAILVTTVAAR